MVSVDGLQTHVVKNGNGKTENNGFRHVNLCSSPLAYTECVSFSPASRCVCRIPKPQHRPGEQPPACLSTVRLDQQFAAAVEFSMSVSLPSPRDPKPTVFVVLPADVGPGHPQNDHVCAEPGGKGPQRQGAALHLSLCFCCFLSYLRPARRRDLIHSSFCPRFLFFLSVWSASPTCCQPSSCCA